MTVKKFNYTKFIIFIVVVIGIILGIIIGITKLVSHINYTKTYEYKLTNVGYNMDEIKILKNKFNNDKLDKLLKRKYDENIAKFVNEKFFIYENLDKYLEYKKNEDESDNSKIVAIVNTEANVEWLDNEKQTDTSKNELMLVNRLYGLDSSFEVKDIVTVSSRYAYDNIKISGSIVGQIESMAEDARNDGYTFVVSAGYRTYKEQQSLYDSYAKSYGKGEADEFVARAGHSEYETGLSFVFEPYKYTIKVDDEKTSAEYLWLRDNAYKYGFIFRFEEDKEYLTGFSADTWRLRYVGTDAAAMIHNENICFEEYYAYFVNKGE